MDHQSVDRFEDDSLSPEPTDILRFLDELIDNEESESTEHRKRTKKICTHMRWERGQGMSAQHKHDKHLATQKKMRDKKIIIINKRK